MSPTDHDRYADSAAAHLLGALPELEEQAFARHVMGCTSCRDEVERLRAAVDALPRSVTPLSPPPSLRHSIMDAVAADLSGAGDETTAAARPTLLARARERFRSAGVVPRLRPAAAWVSAAVLLAAGVVAGLATDELLGGGQPEDRRVAATVDESRLVEGSGTLLVPEDEEHAVLSVNGVPTLPDANTNGIYQVWLVRGDERIPAALLSVGADGSGAATIPQGVDDADAVWVTRERPGGSRAPTERPVMSVSLD